MRCYLNDPKSYGTILRNKFFSRKNSKTGPTSEYGPPINYINKIRGGWSLKKVCQFLTRGRGSLRLFFMIKIYIVTDGSIKSLLVDATIIVIVSNFINITNYKTFFIINGLGFGCRHSFC